MDNHIGDSGVQALAVSLHTCTRLTALAYARCHSLDARCNGCILLTTKKMGMAWLAAHSLASNDISDVGAQALAAALASCGALTTLEYADFARTVQTCCWILA